MKSIKSITASVLSCGAIVAFGLADSAFAEPKTRADFRANSSFSGQFGRGAFNGGELPEVGLEEYNRELAEKALQALYIDADEEAVDLYFAEDYIQHNPFGMNGVEFVKDIFIYSLPEGYMAEADFMLVDGNYALGYSRFTGFTGFYQRPIIAVDVYRIEGDKIVEHWDVIQEEVYADETVSGNAMFPLIPSDEVVTELDEKRNSVIVRRAVAGLVQGDESVVDTFFSDDFIEHSPTAANGKEPLRAFANQERPEGFNYEIGFVVADGPYVAIQTRTTASADDSPVIGFDIFRVSNNLIVEHWEVTQDEVPTEMTASGNAMFPIKSITQCAN